MSRWERQTDGFTVWRSGPLSTALTDAIARQLPKIDFEELEHAVDTFELVSVLGTSNPKEDRRNMKTISQLSHQLNYCLHQLSPDGRAMLAENMKAVGIGAKLQQLRRELAGLVSGADKCLSLITPPKGRPTTAKVDLVLSLAKILENADYNVDAKVDGALVYLTGEILSHLGEDRDYRSLVRNALAKKAVDRS